MFRLKGGFFVSVASVAVLVAVGSNSQNSHDFGYGFLWYVDWNVA